ncbi:hypothetical protein MXB_406 [Myxobolus squamalis]|nr:hypothetical protein MXB_406 [Myxobolus squamalis]
MDLIVETNNGSVYAMDFCPKNDSIIVASGDGNVLLYNCVPLSFVKVLCVTSSKITAIAWHSSAILTTLINPDTLKNNNCIAWCLLFLTDWTIVIGDTTGSVQFWDVYTSTQIQCFKCHKADTLSICVNKNENIIISTSVDRTICYFTKDTNVH